MTMKHGPMPCLLLLPWLFAAGCRSESAPIADNTLQGTITISGAFALYPLAVKWGEEFSKVHPQVRFDIQGGGAGKGMTDVLSGSVDLAMMSRDISPEETAKGAFPIAVAKDAVLPTVSALNPHLATLQARGITREDLANIWITGKVKTWGDLLGNGSADAISVYTRSDAAGAAETWAKFLGASQADLLGVGIFGDPGLAEAVGKDPLAIGFNNVNYVFDLGTRKPFHILAVGPLDLDGNRQLDPGEDCYGTMDQLNEAIGDGRYPSPPARALSFASLNAPDDALVVAFLAWVLGDGQRFVKDAGFVELSGERIQEERRNLGGTPPSKGR